MTAKYKGIGASDGVAIAKSYVLNQPVFNITSNTISDVDHELNLYQQAIDKTIQQIQNIREVAKERLGASKAEIFDAHIQIASDPEISNEIKNLIKSTSINAAHAIEKTYEKYREMFTSMADAYFKERAADIKDVKKRILANVLNLDLPDVINIKQESIIVTYDLSPSETALLNPQYIKGFITAVGGRTSHAAIMARTMEIPAVLGVGDFIKEIKTNDVVAINGSIGEVELNPSNQQEWQDKINHYHEEKQKLKLFINKPSITTDNHRVHLESNIGKPNDIDSSLKLGAEGVGLFRTEFLYMDNTQWPTEEEQFEAYKYVLQQAKDKLIVIRTLDIGGDKKLSYFAFPNELNPFLGYRAIRVSLDKLDIFETQLRALGRASVYGKLAIMFPMIATIDEFVKAKEFAIKCFDKLRNEGIKVSDDIQIGMMVEIPASAILADKFAQLVDFFSIGTNDLIQYTFACDRMSSNVSYLYQPNNPSLLNLIKIVIDAAHKHKKWVGMCGEMAGDMMSIPILLGLGLDAFSMSATSIAKARLIINSLEYSDCKKIANEVITLKSQDEVNHVIDAFLKQKKLLF